jgi:uncharacterized protein
MQPDYRHRAQFQQQGHYGTQSWGEADGREAFIARTYNHLFLAIAAFAGLEIALFKTGFAEVIARGMMGGGALLVFGGFVVVSWLATSVAYRAESKAAQYAALAAYVVLEAIVFVPLLMLANVRAPGAIQSAAAVTLVGFAGLTGIALLTKKDFSFLGGVLRWAGFAVLGLIVASLVFGFTLGTLFSVAMVALSGAAILFETSRVQREFPEDRYVAAALSLFASVAMMFWYILRIFIGSRR